jgi:hypothetical protein
MRDIELILAIFLPGVLICTGFFKKRSRLVTFFLLVLIWIIFALDTKSPDHDQYELAYWQSDYAVATFVEIGFKYWMVFCRDIGMTYLQFRMQFGLVYVTLLYWVTSRLTLNVNAVLALYLIWPCLVNASGIRHAFASLIVLLFVPFLRRQGVRYTIAYLFGILFSMTFHTGTVFHAVYIFAKSKMTWGKWLILVTGMLFLTFAINSPLLYVFALALDVHSISKWTVESQRMNIVGVLVNTAFVIMFFLLCLTARNISRKNTDASHDNIRLTNISSKEILDFQCKSNTELYYTIATYNLLIIIGLLLASEYLRLLNGTILIYYAAVENLSKENHHIGSRSLEFVTVMLVILLTVFYSYSYTSHDLLGQYLGNLLFQ